jgi:hypothetical protein
MVVIWPSYFYKKATEWWDYIGAAALTVLKEYNP